MTTPVGRIGRWLALVAALLGWMFDGMEMGLFPLIGRSALIEFFKADLSPEEKKLLETRIEDPVAQLEAVRWQKQFEARIGQWNGVITALFLVGAATGGVLFGWLGDKLGRIRALTLSVFLYAGCSGLSAFSTEAWQLGLLRFFGALGMGGEWALGVALVMELWPDTSRGWLAGWIGAFGNLGYMVIGGVALILLDFGSKVPEFLTSLGLSESWRDRLTAGGNWRLLLLFGATPAFLTLLIRLFVPESERWVKERDCGRTSHWSSIDLVAVLVGAVMAMALIACWAFQQEWNLDYFLLAAITILGLIVVVLCYLYPARRYLQRSAGSTEESRQIMRRMLLGAVISGIPLLATWGGFMWIYQWVNKLEGQSDYSRPTTQVVSALTAALGCLIGAVLGEKFGRRIVYATLCLLSLFVLLGLFNLNDRYDLGFLIWAGLGGLITASFYGWLPLYLPELFPTRVRATGQGFSFNFGRILAAIGALQTGALLQFFEGSYARACSIAAGIYILGFIVIWFVPETKNQKLPE